MELYVLIEEPLMYTHVLSIKITKLHSWYNCQTVQPFWKFPTPDKLEIDLKQNDDWRAAGGPVTVVTAPVTRPISSFRHFDGRRLSRHFGDLKAGARRRQGL